MSVVSRMEDGVFDHAIDINRFEEGMKRRTIGFLKEMSDDISRLLSDSPTLLQADRLNSLLGQVDGVIADAHKSAKVDMRNQLIDFAPIEEKATTKIMNDSLEADLFSPKMTSMQLQAVVDDSLIRGALGSKWWDRLEENTKNKITKGIQLGIAEGESMSQIKTRLLGKTTGQFETYEVGGKTRRRMKRVGGWIQASNREAEAVIRTSVHSVASNVRDKTYLANLDVIDQIQSVATLDGRTTPICASYDGLRWTADGHKPVGGHGKAYLPTPRHWNCRSTHVPVLGELDKLDAIAKTKGIKIPPATRASVQGKVPALTKMDDWLLIQPEVTQNKLLGGVAKGDLYRKGFGTFKVKDFTGRRGDPLNIEDLRAKFNILKVEAEKPSVAVGEKISPFGRHKGTFNPDLMKQGQKWRDSLTDEQAKAIHDNFTGEDYVPMRAVMRGGTYWPDQKNTLDPRELRIDTSSKIKLFDSEEDFNFWVEKVDEFRSGIETAPEFEGVVFRGAKVNSVAFQRKIGKLVKEGGMNMPADSSATWDFDTARSFMRSSTASDERQEFPILYWYKQRTGKSVEMNSSHSGEHEVIIRQQTRFDLVKVHWDKKDWSSDEKKKFKDFAERGGGLSQKDLDELVIIELEEI